MKEMLVSHRHIEFDEDDAGLHQSDGLAQSTTVTAAYALVHRFSGFELTLGGNQHVSVYCSTRAGVYTTGPWISG